MRNTNGRIPPIYPQPFTVCGFCGKEFVTINFRQHKLDCVVLNEQLNRLEETPKTRNNPTKDEQLRINETKREQKKIDGANDYWKIRDNGKFGSHPSYDDMSDESFS